MGDNIFKIMMNSLYGKTGQKPNGKTIQGDAQTMLNKINYLSSMKDNRLINNVNFKSYPSNMFD